MVNSIEMVIVMLAICAVIGIPLRVLYLMARHQV
jgi:hypothetical protein